jgi:UDP-hydrolysing UDP-N-acetyl-D-glucosamine 2-epimerase
MGRSMPLKVCVVTASRSEYGLMRWIIRDVAADAAFSLALVVTGSHLSKRHGHTVDEIVADGNDIALRIPVELNDQNARTLAGVSAAIVTGLSEFLALHRPDIVLVLGDRWEMLAVASACTFAGVPLGHFSGGEVTEGVFDDSVRHALTKLSHLHFVANETYAKRVRQLGEEDWRIVVCGGPGIDNFHRLELFDRAELSERIGLDLSQPTALVTFHPPTRGSNSIADQVEALTLALKMARDRFGLQFVITGPAADPGADEIEARLRDFAKGDPTAAVYIQSLGTQLYLSLLKAARLMIGNSSSAYNEAPVGGLIAVDIGDRQKGRLSGGNIIKVGHSASEIFAGIAQALERPAGARFECPYGTGSASPVARAFIQKVFSEHSRDDLLRKRFVDQALASAVA